MLKTNNFKLIPFSKGRKISEIWLRLLPLILLGGFASASLSSLEYNEKNQAYQEVIYTPHYQGESDLIPGKIRVQIQAVVENRYGKEAWTEPQDQWVSADFKVYLSNITYSTSVLNFQRMLLVS